MDSVNISSRDSRGSNVRGDMFNEVTRTCDVKPVSRLHAGDCSTKISQDQEYRGENASVRSDLEKLGGNMKLPNSGTHSRCMSAEFQCTQTKVA
jgi:hypothetical protein